VGGVASSAVEPVSMLPCHEFDTFLMTITDATEFAREWNVGDGYIALLAGLYRAKQAREEGEPWGAELVGRYEAALERYARLYGVARG
jgi:hypothetical protein